MAKDKNIRKMTFRQPKKEGAEDENPAIARANFLFEHVALALMTAFACAGGLLWMVAIATDYWVISISSSIEHLIQNIDKNSSVQQSDIFLWSYSGLWRRCDIFYQQIYQHLDSDTNSTLINISNIANHITRCDYHLLSKTKNNNSSDLQDVSGNQAADFIHAEISVVILVVIIMTLALGFSVYALRYPRYMYKRVAGALHVFTAITLFVIIELVKSGEHPSYIEPSKTLDPHTSNKTIQVQNYHGYSFLLAWTALLMFVCTAISFICMSGKKKSLLQDSEIVLK